MPDTPIYTGLGAKELLTVSFAVPVGVTTGMIELAAAASDTLPAAWLTPDAVAIVDGMATASLMVGNAETINPPTGIYWLWYRVVSGGEVLIREYQYLRFVIVNADGAALPKLGPWVATVNHVGPDADGNVDTSDGGGLVTSVFGRIGVVAAAGGDYAAFYDAIGAATAAQAAAIAAAATDATTKANAAAAASQPLDADLTAIAALATTAYGRALLALADAAALRTAAALGTAATANTTAFDPAGAAAAAAAASQPLDADLTAIAALTTTAFGRSFLALVDAGAGRTLLGLGSLATQSGTFSGTSSGTNTGDQDLSVLVPKSLFTAKGDIVAATAAAAPAIVPVGADGLALVADAASAAGLKWASAAGNPSGTPEAQFTSGRTFSLQTGNAPRGTAGLADGTITGVPVYLPAGVLEALGSFQTTTVTGSFFRLGLYRMVGGVPGPLVLDAGTTNGGTNSSQMITGLTTVLTAGWYVPVCVPQKGSGASVPNVGAVVNAGAQGISVATVTLIGAPSGGWISATTVPGSGPLPAAWGTASNTNQASIVLGAIAPS